MHQESVTPKTKRTPKKKLTKTQAKAQLAKELIKKKAKGDPERLRANIMLQAFQKALRFYKQNDFLQVGGVTNEGKLHGGTLSALLRACEVADGLGVDYETFVNAQFWAFDKWFSAAPKLHQLATTDGENSAEGRVKQYQKAIREGEVKADKVFTGRSSPAPKIPLPVVFRKNDQVFQQFVKNWKMTPQEVFLNFAKTPHEARLYFDRRWLAQNELYQQMRANGLVG